MNKPNNNTGPAWAPEADLTSAEGEHVGPFPFTMQNLRGANDWRVGDVVVVGPDWYEGFGTCHCCGKTQTSEEYFSRENSGTMIVEKVRRVHGDVGWIALRGWWSPYVKRYGLNWYRIGPKAKRYILNPNCDRGGYRERNASKNG